jgi:hypothetical protein
MQLNTSWEAASCAAAQEFSRNLWNLKVYYLVQEGHPLIPILSQINPVHTIPFHLPNIYFNIMQPTALSLPNGLFLSGFPTSILYAFIFSPFVLHALPISSSLT